MLIGERIRQLREEKHLSQGDMEKASGLLRVYISRVEHGHTVPSLETLERFAAALDVPLFRLFYTGDDVPARPHLSPRRTLEELAEEGGTTGSEARFLLKLKGFVGRMVESDFTSFRRLLEKESPASDDADLAFGTLAKLFSKL